MEQKLHKIFGGIRMTWPFVIVFAVITGVFTALMALTVPSGWSLHQIAATLEAWVVFAVFIIANCEKPREAAAKTFVFFLISQPLVYLLQVPFSALGFGLFRYYPYWFFVTLLTFPGAWLGWYIKKDDIRGGIILSVMTVLQMLLAVGYVRQCIYRFPRMLFAAVFCIASVPMMILGVFRSAKARNTAFLITIIATVFFGAYQLIGPLNGECTVAIDTKAYPIDSTWTVTVSEPALCSAELTTIHSEFQQRDDLVLQVTFKKVGETTVYLTNSTLTYSTEVAYFRNEDGGYGTQHHGLTLISDENPDR